MSENQTTEKYIYQLENALERLIEHFTPSIGGGYTFVSDESADTEVDDGLASALDYADSVLYDGREIDG